MLTPRAGKMVAAKLGYGVLCLLGAVTLVVSGYAHKAVGYITQTEKGITISGGPTTGAMNILVMGLESRTNYEGQTLSAQELTETHSGNVQSVSSGQVGAQDTDTLILIHIFAGGQKAVGFSIPRDDLVTYPRATYLGITRGKIDQAYDYAYNLSLQQTYGSSMSQSERYLKANQAGQAFEIATVSAVTGVKISHFVEANLIGFYYLAQAFGGIEVCVRPWSGDHGGNLSDKASGWDAALDGYNLRKGGPQYLHLAADQALAFVRARDTLPGIDLGRTKRQQAVLDYVIWKLKNEAVFSDFSLLNSLAATASQYLITDSTFNLAGFAADMHALTGRHMMFSTLPVSGQVNDMPLNGFSQDVNLINVPYLKRYVGNAFYPMPATEKTSARASGKTTAAKKTTVAPARSTVTVDVYNGSGVSGLAGDVSRDLAALGYKAGAVDNASDQSQTVEPATQVFYGDGASANAANIAAKFSVTAKALTTLPAGHVEVLLGSTLTQVPASLIQTSGTSTSASSPPPSPMPAAGANNGAVGGAITVPPNAPYGIPCVY
jgi:LCP family protein required for cell wall assembly